MTLSVNYIGMRSDNLFLSRDINAPLPPAYGARPNLTYGVVREMESTGRLRSNALQLTLRGGLTKYFTGQTQYTLRKTLNDTGGIGWFPANDYDLSGEYGRADYDQRHRFDSLGTFKVGDLFNVTAALALYSGKPYSLLAGADVYKNGRSNARPPGVTRNTLIAPEFHRLCRHGDLPAVWPGSGCPASPTTADLPPCGILIGGLFSSTVLTLFLLPVLYERVFRGNIQAHERCAK